MSYGPKMYLKIHQSSDRFVVAVCDKDLIGKTLKFRDAKIKISERFYKGDLKSEDEIIEILKNAANINLMGKKSCEAGIKAKVITNNAIINIQGVPHAQSYAIEF